MSVRAQRIGPQSGYDFGEKRQYRRNIWRVFRQFCVGRLDSAQAVLMPSIEGDEIDVALANGFRAHNLHVVDANAAIIVSLKKRYPGINGYGVDITDAARRIVKACGRVDVANLDLCGNLSLRLMKSLSNVAESGMLNGSLASITALRGRESADIARTMSSAPAVNWYDRAVYSHGTAMTQMDLARYQGMQAALFGGANQWREQLSAEDTVFAVPVRSGIYKSTAGSQTMLWGMFAVLTKRHLDTDLPCQLISLVTPQVLATVHSHRLQDATDAKLNFRGD